MYVGHVLGLCNGSMTFFVAWHGASDHCLLADMYLTAASTSQVLTRVRGCAHAQVFMLPSDAELNVATMRSVLGSGHSRFPVHRPGNRHAAACSLVPLSPPEFHFSLSFLAPPALHDKERCVGFKPQS